MAFKMKNAALKKQADMAGCPRSAAKMKAESTMKMKSPMEMKKSPMEKELVGKQGNLPPELKAKIEAAPAKMRNRKGAMETESPMKLKEVRKNEKEKPLALQGKIQQTVQNKTKKPAKQEMPEYAKRDKAKYEADLAKKKAKADAKAKSEATMKEARAYHEKQRLNKGMSKKDYDKMLKRKQRKAVFGF
jgi:cell pole-organizing protein PopZ